MPADQRGPRSPRDPSAASDAPDQPRFAEVGHKVGPGPVSPHLRGEFTYSIISAPPVAPSRTDQRGNMRLRTRLRTALVADRRDKVIADCLIQDRSGSGARLRLSLDRPLPKTFILSDELTKTRFWAELAWQKGRDAGVRLRPV